MKKIILILITAFFIFSSCQKVKDPGATAAVKAANEWWVTLDLDGTTDVYGIGHFKIATYNTSANDNNIWVDDNGNGWVMKVKTPIDYTNLTFAASAAPNAYFNVLSTATAETVNLTDGKIFPKLAHSRTGNVCDSIHMKLEFSDDPGTVYEMNGVARSMFPDDDWP